MKHFTQEDIARKLNVTRITVSKALRNHPDISAVMKKRVMDIADEMGYSPNQIAQQLTTRTTNTIGVIVPDLENSFFSHVVNSIIDAATDRGYQILLAVSRENEEIEKKNIQNLIGKRMDGLLVCLSQHTTDPGIFETVRKMEIPLVFFDRALAGTSFSRVVFDDDKGVRMAIDRLVIAGFTRIAHLSGYSNTSIGKERLEGYQAALEKNGLILWKEWVIEGGYEINDGYQSFIKLYKRGNLPEIVLTANDRVALGVYKACKELDLRIPEDIGVIGFGFPETTEMFSPPLAVISQNPRLMGQAAAKQLIDEIQATPSVPAMEIRLPEDFHWNSSLKLKR
ncbi:MAG: LacI family DNA-binding transcriptional regulator [Bacteroidia bacterium]|nr:LacI family DNA-binding transcriptional regulator [Bacteroidia bacterium]